MAEEILDEVLTGGPGPGQPGLADEHRAKLDSIVQQMIKNKESDSDIQMVVNDFKQKYSTKQSQAQQQKPEQAAFKLSEPTFRAIQKESIVTPSAPNEKINIQKSEVGYIPDEKTYKIQQQQGKAKVAHENVNNALVGNDAQYEKKLRESRRDNFTIENLRDQYKQNGQILSPQDEQRLLQKEKDRLYNMPVTKDELTDFKTGTILTPKLSRKFIKDLNNKDVAESAYQVDKFNELANDPDPNAHNRIEKINEVAKGIKKGTYVYDPETKTVVQPIGMIGSIMEGVKNKFKNDEEHDFLKNTTNDAAIISQLEDERNNPNVDEPVKVPRGKLNEALQTVAEMPVLPMVAGAVGTVGGTFIGNPELGTVAATALGAYENRKAQYRSTFKQVYNEMRNQGKPEFDALTEARKQAENAQEIGTITGAAQGYLGAKIGEIPVKGTSFNLGYQKAVGDFLKKNGSDLGKIVLDAAAQGGIGAAGEITKNKLAQAAGIKRDWDEGTENAFWGNALMTAGIGAAIKLGRGMSKLNYKTILNGLTKSVPEETINSALQEKVATGDITQAAADEALKEINDYKAKDLQIPANVTEEARFKIQDNIDKLNKLQAMKEATHESLHGPIKEKIQELIDQNLALAKETVKEEKPVSGLEKSKEKEAVDFAHELVDEGVLPDTYHDAIKKDPIKFWQTVAQQAQNRDENWKPLSNPLDEQAVRDNYGDTVVDYAKELFPAPEIPEIQKSVSVIQPGEIKQPETITIKPQENAQTIRGDQGEVSVEGNVGGQRPDTRSENIQLDEGATPGTPETEQQAGIPAQEGASEGKEGIGTPPIVPGAKNVYAEQPPTQLSFRGLQEVANEFGYEDVKSRDRVSDLQERKNAEIEAAKWAAEGTYQQNIDHILNETEARRLVPTARQRLHLEQYLANERQRAREMSKNSAEYDRQLLKLQRIKDIGQIARQEAGAALRLPNEGTVAHPITDESSAMIAKMEANAVDKLTDQQKAEVEAQVDKYKKANEEANAKVAELEEKVAKLDAQKEFNKTKSTTKRVKKTAEERIAFRRSEIEAAKAALDKLKKGGGPLYAVPLPGVAQLMAIAPHVKNIMVDLVAQGVANLQDVISHLHNEFKDVLDGITEKNIHDIIAGEYNEPGRPLSELQRQVKDLQEEAKLINQIEALENGVEPKNEKAKRERNQKIKELREKIKDLKKEDGAEELRAIKKRNEEQQKKIKEKIDKGQFGKETKKSIFDREDVKQKHPQLRKEALDAIAAKEEAQHEFDLALYNDEMKRRNWWQKTTGFGGKLVHTSKALLSGIDDSATFVQNGLAMLANPKTGAKVWLKHWKDAFSDANFKRELTALHQRPDWDIIQKSGLDVVEPHSAASKQVEEAFEQNLLAGKIKINGKDYQPWKYTGGIFERAFTSMGNNFRVALFDKRMKMLLDEGKTFESHPQEYKAAAQAINDLTGRAKLPNSIAQASPWLTPIIWAPRLLASTLNTLGLSDVAFTVMGKGEKGYYRSLTPTQRKFALGQLGKGIGMGVAVMGAASLAGAKVDCDPRSVTFGDIIVGDHHFNVFGRYTPVIKTIVQAAYGVRLKNGEPQDLDSGKFGAKTRAGVIGGFFRGKMTPMAGTVYDLLAGTNYYTGKKFTVKDLPEALLQPMSVKELRDGWRNDGTATILNRFLPAFEGIKTSDERDFQKNNSGGNKSKKSTHSKANHISHKHN